MNTSNSFLPDYSMPTPPWKAATSIANNSFPIPPRNDPGMAQKSTNFEWNKAASQSIGLGVTDYRLTQTQAFPASVGLGIGGNDLNRGGGPLLVGTGNLFDNRNIGVSEPPRFDNNQFGTNIGGFNDKFNNTSGGSFDRNNGPNTVAGNFDRGGNDRRSFDRNDNFDRRNTYDVGGNFNQGNINDRGGNTGNFNQGNNLNNKPELVGSSQPPWKSQNNDNRNNTPNDNRNNQNQNRQRDSPRGRNEQDRRRTRQSVNDNVVSQPKPAYQAKSPINQAKTPLKNPVREAATELERKALDGDVTEEFFNKIKPLSLMQVAADVALRYARKEYYLSKGNNQKVPEKPTGHGQYTCKTCFMNFMTKEKLNTHNNNIQHKELEDLFRLKKEQARLIMDKKIVAPTRPKLNDSMIQISRAEVENNLKPTEMELDVYILGVYESVMKPYWPLPKSKFYCRVCNYAEFTSESELKRHNLTIDHKKREATYEEAFCLYCQRHYFDKNNLEKHVLSPQHIKIKDLMEKTKECAVEHWHKVNNLEIPEKFGVTKADDSKEKEIDIRVEESPRVGSKRSASDTDENKSPMKKQATSKPEYTSPKIDNSSKNDNLSKSDNKIDTKKPDKIDSKSSDKKSTEKKPTSKSDSKSENRDKKDDSKSSSRSDTKPPPKSDTKSVSKTDTKTALKSESKSTKPDSRSSSRSDTKDSSKADGKGDSKPDSKSSSKIDAKLTTDSKSDSKDKISEKEKVWYVPMTGFMCIACHDYIADDVALKKHSSESKHKENITKFKKMIVD